MKKIDNEDIRMALRQKLPGALAYKTLLPKGRPTEITQHKKNNIRKSAVLVAIFKKENMLYFCLTRRSRKMKHHPGQISFPGGACEKTDASVIETALREMEEETGISPRNIDIIGKLSELYIPVSNFLIHPVVGFINNVKGFKIDNNEVEELITIPVIEFLNEKNIASETIPTFIGNLETPCYKINGHVIWGATAMIIAEFSWMLKQHQALREGYSGNVESGR
ncbi:MAG: CoA pyrophosphatase [Prolixibacteraceae bacterium]|nr:CoA pyrophosphatase [Prolixibacteraceae bacterium]